MKYIKILIQPFIWHLKPYKIKYKVTELNPITEFGWLCLKLVITHNYKSKTP